MTGSVIITGANGSLAVPAVTHLLSKHPDLTLLLTVRDASSHDANTAKLKETIARFPGARASIHALDLASLSAVHAFADHVAAGVEQGTYPPLRALVANAFHWNLVAAGQATADGYEKTFQINHVAQAALVLRLLGSFDKTAPGRVVFFASDAHWPGKNGLEKIPPGLPEDLDRLVQLEDAGSVAGGDYAGRGFQRYANSKLAIVAFMYALNRRLEKDSTLSNVTAIAVDPGSLSDSRALRTNTPTQLRVIQRFVLQPLRPLLALGNPTLRTSAKAAADIVELAVGPAAHGDADKQEKLWAKTVEWAGITKENSVLGGSGFSPAGF
ncbi:4-hydroxybenzoate polyprenyltransferase- mitochondrial [Apiospora hydei]|uniref:3beta-hydroxysteroid 3-dehydrogenase n=1 Tax=Apiospora hydei TaxID=1337664 RepID=A0ABR1UYZ6_9PEZI